MIISEYSGDGDGNLDMYKLNIVMGLGNIFLMVLMNSLLL